MNEEITVALSRAAYKIYQGVKEELGDNYQEMVKPYRNEISQKMKTTGQDLFVITMELLEANPDVMDQVLLLSAYMEMKRLQAWAPEN